MSAIEDRIDAALEKMRAQGVDVRGIYLDAADRKALDKAKSREFGHKLYTFSYRDHEVRDGKRSVIYSTHGVGFVVPKLLSHRVAA